MLEDMAPTERMQDATNDIPPGLNASDMTVLQSRRISVRAELDRIGASPDFCRNYFQSASGKCEEQRGCACVKHATSAFTLPKGKMGEAEFRTYALELEGRIVGAKSNVDRYRAGYRELTADGFLATGIPERELVKRRRTLEQQMRHEHGLLQQLRGEEYRLLEDVEPLSEREIASFHSNCSRLMDELTHINRVLKVGREQPAADGGPRLNV